MPPNTLQVHTDYVLVKSVGPKVLWVVATKTTSTGDWRIFPFPPVPCLNCGGGDRCCRHLSSPRNFTELNRTVTCIELRAKANDRRTSSPLSR
ncbi:uncharacterized protein TNCV_396221 [Trichonephila clavipes]|nr:uncharacterized protein TNCV_396221 [Trichonephila clavipes]